MKALYLSFALSSLACGPHGAVIYDGVPLAIGVDANSSARVTFNSDGSHVVVEFGSIALGKSSDENLSLNYLGYPSGSPNELTIIRVTTYVWTHLEWEIGIYAGQKVAQGASLSIPIRFTPTTPGDTSLKVMVTTDSSEVPTIEFDLSGQGADADPTWAQDPSPCGPVPLNSSLTITMTLKNDKTFPVHLVADPELANASSPGPFQWAPGFPLPAQVLPAGGSLGFPIVFTPTSAGAFDATLTVFLDDPTQSPPVLPITCTAGP